MFSCVEFKISSPEFNPHFFHKYSAFCLMRTFVSEIGLEQVYNCEGFVETFCSGLHTVHLIVTEDEGLCFSGEDGKNVVFGTQLKQVKKCISVE